MLGDYERVGIAVQSAQATIWKAVDPALKRDVGLKHLRGPDAAEAARREASVLAGLRHPNIVSVYDVFDDDGVWLVEQWITGAPLAAVLKRIEKLSAIDALALVHGALSGLAYAHDRDVVHGDVTPANILIDQAGTPMLVDFGLAVSPGETSLGGTPGYMAPEASAGGTVDKRSDVYSSCVVLAELLTGTRLFAGSALEIAHAQGAAPQLSGIGGPIADVVAAGLDPGPRHRPADAGTLLTRLEAAAETTHGKGWLAAAGLGTIGSTAATVGAGVTMTGTAAAGAAATSVAGTAASTVGRGKLFAAAGVGTAAVAGIVAFVALQPSSPPTPVASPATTTTTTTTTPPPPVIPPPPPVQQGPIMRGTYSMTGTFRTATVVEVVHVASDCARCDISVTSERTGYTGVATWNGVGWERTSGDVCSTRTLYIPGAEIDGIVQELTIDGEVFPGCGTSGPVTGSGVRTGD